MSGGWVPLGQLARVSLGFKSLQNDFFYVNQATIDTYGIEPEFILPILMLANMNSRAIIQKVDAELFLVKCDKPESALKGTGVLRYIRTMATKTAAQKKQSGKPQTMREVLEQQGGTHWYAPKAAPAQANIWLRKAFGDVYSPFIFDTPVLVDQRCNKVETVEGLDWKVLASYMTSSVFSLTLEVNGAAGLGGGALEAATKRLADMPVPDLRTWDRAKRKELLARAKSVWLQVCPYGWRGATAVPDQVIALDEFVLSAVGSVVPVERMHKELQETCRSRYVLADDKKRSVKQKTSADIGSVARSIAESVQPLLDSRRFPEDFQDAHGVLSIHLPGARSLRITFHPLLDHADLKIAADTDVAPFEYTGPLEIADLIRHAVLLGRREFDVTSDRNDAQVALTKFYAWVEKIRQRISTGIQSSALGTGYENVLEERVFELLRMHPAAGSNHPPSEVTVRGAAT